MVTLSFVRRKGELGQLHALLDRALAGHGQVAFVAGEAGSGKSALLRAFAEQVQTQNLDLMAALGNCNAQSSLSDPYLPLREVLAVLTGLTGDSLAPAVDAPATNRLKMVFARAIQHARFAPSKNSMAS